MKKAAYHRLVFMWKVVEGPVVVETDDDGDLIGWHMLRGEEPFVEWRGGEFLAYN